MFMFPFFSYSRSGSVVKLHMEVEGMEDEGSSSHSELPHSDGVYFYNNVKPRFLLSVSVRFNMYKLAELLSYCDHHTPVSCHH